MERRNEKLKVFACLTKDDKSLVQYITFHISLRIHAREFRQCQILNSMLAVLTQLAELLTYWWLRVVFELVFEPFHRKSLAVGYKGSCKGDIRAA